MSTETEAQQIEAPKESSDSGEGSLYLDLSFFEAPDDGDAIKATPICLACSSHGCSPCSNDNAGNPFAVA